MADKKDDKVSSDSGLGNLPPLSDFDSTNEEISDSGLPPLGTFDSGLGTTSSGGLPPIDSLKEETPRPGGGAIKPPPPGFEAPSPMDSSSGSLPAGMGFQDLAVDSDFSPETPDLGPGPSPGPSSGLDTPNLFDSAFGPADAFGGAVGTPAPTQAMETPMFGSTGAPPGGGMGFDDDAFSAGAFGAGKPPAAGGGFGGGMAFDSGTPAPDFSPDTELQAAVPLPTPAELPGKKKAKGGSPTLALALAVVGLIIGVVASPYIPLAFLPNPIRVELEQAKTRVTKLEKDIKVWEDANPGGTPTKMTPEELDKIRASIQEAQKTLNDTLASLESKKAEQTDLDGKLDEVQKALAAKNDEYETAQKDYQELSDESFLMNARLRGLDAEVERLSKFVVDLDAANQQRIVAKDALLHSVDRLIIQIQEAMPLTPEKFAHQDRLAAAKALRQRIDSENWATPELLNAYTDIYVKELQVAASQEYFFANLPLTDRNGNRSEKWAECVMEGNAAVYYRSLDGLNAGIYRNTGSAETPSWQFCEIIEPKEQEVITAKITPLRIDGFEQKAQILTGQAVGKSKTPIKRIFSSL